MLKLLGSIFGIRGIHRDYELRTARIMSSLGSDYIKSATLGEESQTATFYFTAGGVGVSVRECHEHRELLAVVLLMMS